MNPFFRETLNKTVRTEPVEVHTTVWHMGFDKPVLSNNEGLSPNGTYLIGASLVLSSPRRRGSSGSPRRKSLGPRLREGDGIF